MHIPAQLNSLAAGLPSKAKQASKQANKQLCQLDCAASGKQTDLIQYQHRLLAQLLSLVLPHAVTHKRHDVPGIQDDAKLTDEAAILTREGLTELTLKMHNLQYSTVISVILNMIFQYH